MGNILSKLSLTFKKLTEDNPDLNAFIFEISLSLWHLATGYIDWKASEISLSVSYVNFKSLSNSLHYPRWMMCSNSGGEMPHILCLHPPNGKS